MVFRKFKIQNPYKLNELFNKFPLIFSTGSYLMCILVVLKTRITQLIPFQLETIKEDKRDGTEIKFLNTTAIVYTDETQGWQLMGFTQCEQYCLNSIKFISQINFSLVYRSHRVGNFAISWVGIPLFVESRFLDISKVVCEIDMVVVALEVWQGMATVLVRS